MEQATTTTDQGVQDKNTAPQTGEQDTSPETKETSTEDSLMGDSKEAESKTEESLMGDKEEPKKDTAEDDKKVDNVPEKYEAFKLPENYQMSDEQFSDFSVFAKELNLTQESAQKLVDYHAKLENKRAESQKQAEQKAFEDGIKEDIAVTRKKYGDKYDEAFNIAKNAVKAFMPKELKDTFVEAGFDKNPYLFDFLYNVGSKISEDTFVEGDRNSTKPESYGKYSEILPQNPKLGKR